MPAFANHYGSRSRIDREKYQISLSVIDDNGRMVYPDNNGLINAPKPVAIVDMIGPIMKQ
jgi:hypothetical protein